MKKLMIAATMVAVANMAYAPSAAAQTADEAAGEDEFLKSLQEEKAETSADRGEAKNSGTEAKAESPEATPDKSASADAAPAKSAPSEAAPAPSEAPLDVIPVPQKESVSAPAPQPQKAKSQIEEIIVTAQRREESVQDVPISITVFNQEQLTNANITNSSDLATYTPSLSTNARFGNENATFAIRGFTQDLRTTASVATYFAEVVAPRGQSSQTSGDGAGPGTLFDLQNVQVLKGPQGTLFGRNTTGGAVLLVPNKPSDEFEGYVELSGGDFEARRIQAVVNVPVHERIRLRFGVDSNEREGHLNNFTHIGADDLGNVDYSAYRLSGVLDITDSLENYTILSYVDSTTHGYTSGLFACNPNPDPTVNPFFAFTGQQCQAQLANQAATGQDGFYDLASTINTPISTIEEKRLINTTTWDVTDNVTFKNILAYAHLHTENGSDIFGTQFRLAADPDPSREFKVGVSVLNPDVPVTSQETWVEEIQLLGSALDERLQWQTGAYYEHSKPDGFSGNNSAALLSCEMATIEGDPSQFNCFDITAGQLGSVLVQKYKTDYLNRAVYAQGTFDLLEHLSATVGIRYTWDETKGNGIKTRYTFVGPVPQAPIQSTSSPTTASEAPTGLLELSYRPTDAVMTYAKYIRGYRQGSVNLAADPGVDTWDPEHVNTYEIGAKTSFEGVIAGRFNVAAFYNQLTDMQLQSGYVSQTSGTTTAIFNAGKARIAGVELEAFLQLLENLSASLSYAYLDTKLLEQDDHRAEVEAAGGAVAGATFTPIADVGDTLPFAADHTYVASLTYDLPTGPQIGEINVGATFVHTGKRRAAATSSTPFDELDPFELLNLNLNWGRMFGSALDLSVFATNVLDEEYMTYVGGTYNILGFESRQVGLPRTIGARLKYNFGARAQ